jgi:hypothetical protein
MEELPDLRGRIAKCKFCDVTRYSSMELDGFEYRGIGSYYAMEMCRNCGKSLSDHAWGGLFAPDEWGKTGKVNPEVCLHVGLQFTPVGDSMDEFFCGCDEI